MMDSKDRIEPAKSGPLARRSSTQPVVMSDATYLQPASPASSSGSINVVQTVLRAVMRHGWKILAIWLALTAGLVYAIQVRVKPTYETFSLLRVEPADRDLFGLGLNSAEVFDHFLQTQVQLITSPNVLLAALSQREVASTTIVREADDPESELRKRLQVGIVPGSYLVRVAMTTPHPDQASKIVNAVVEQYLVVAQTWSSEKNKSHISNLEQYHKDLKDKVDRLEAEWLDLAAKGNVDLVESTQGFSAPGSSAPVSSLPQAAPNKVSADEYKRVREQLFQINMDLIEAEALLDVRRAEANAVAAGVDPEVLLRQEVDAAVRNDPEMLRLYAQCNEVQQKIDQARRLTKVMSDPSIKNPQAKLRALKEQIRQIYPQKFDEYASRSRGGGADPRATLADLANQIDAMKARKAGYEKMLGQIEVTNRQQGTDTVKVALLREDLGSLRSMQDSVQKRIEQLSFDSKSEARIKAISKARASGMLVSDSRRKLWIVTPVGVFGLVLGLFMFLEIRSGRVADLDEVSRRVPVDVYPVPSLPGTRKSNDQRVLRTNEAQLQEFLQSLDHLRVSLWFGDEKVNGVGRCLVVTSAVGGEGKTTLSAHLAVCCAKAGISTLVIDADLRRAALSKMFEEEQTPGLSDVLKGDLSPEDAVVALREGGFHLLPAGSPGEHPGWLFQEKRIGQVLDRYRELFDLVIIDTPPVLPVADTLSLGRWVDGTILVIRYDVSRFALVDRARKRLLAAGIPILKTVVNGVRSSRFASGYEGYGYGGGAYSYSERTQTDSSNPDPDRAATVDSPGASA
jgi:succinoglycan biosynthesis transport protein ExoP